MYIRSTGNISPQKTFGHPPFLTQPVEYTGNRLSCIEPDYKNLIDIKQIRRMSRIIRMGVAAAMECLQEAGVEIPDAIITGTAYGCLEDTAVFLTKMVEYNEEMLTPTAFIQSTHNTIGAQIGLLLQCKKYNNAFVHRGFSFESALLDAMMLLQEEEFENVLVGGIDEITDTSHTILSRMGLYKKGSISSLEIFNSHSRGTVAGEGAAFFLLSNKPSATDYAAVRALVTFYKPGGINEITQQIESFLQSQSISINDIDCIITGDNGDSRFGIFEALRQSIFKDNRTVNFKHLCGDYPTASAFALWTAANILKTGEVPDVLAPHHTIKGRVKLILVYNNYQNIHHSLFLVAAC
ncbi:MAG TPA: beta-ketoacyl synthase chain length factor [Ferruginibacter sp.]|nr:beta-ketoacyl synthase chain length factor [Ferruginibacter sp.]